MEKSRPNRVRKFFDAFFAVIARERVWVAFMVALGFICAIYRLELAAEIYYGADQPTSLQPAHVPLLAFLQTPVHDLTLILILGLTYLAVKYRVRSHAPRLAANLFFRVFEAMVALVALAVIALVMRAHCQLLFQLETGLTMTFLQLSPEMMGTRDFFALFSVRDVVFLVAPAGVFLLALGGGPELRRVYKWCALIIVVLVLAIQIPDAGKKLTAEVSLNPLVYLADDAMADALHIWLNRDSHFRDTNDLPGEPQLDSIQFVDNAFVTGPKLPLLNKPAHPRTSAGKPWNILFFVLESTGSDYIFDQSQSNDVPMPFLQQMMNEGLYLTNHHAAANNSAQSAFSIFTGLYPCPTPDIFAMEKNVNVPTLNRYLSPDYHFFLIHPTDASYSFPEAMFRNNGLKEFDSKENLPPGRYPDVDRLALNELDAIDFLKSRLPEIREPFLGVYWSFIPHFPYDDYGPEFRIMPDLDDKKQLYYNNLRALDTQLRKVFEQMVETGLADRTLFVFVGDHGEAFNQHPGVWTHSLGSYSEMYRVPMLFWQPRLVPRQIVKYPTSHPDIVPTVLDLIGVPYDTARFQGESILRGEPVRKFIFNMDARADHVSSIGKQMNKVSICFDDDTVTAFNLAKDPGEKFPLNEARFHEQTDTLLKFKNFQVKLIESYNDAVIAHESYPSRHGHHTGSATNQVPVATSAGN